MPVIKPISDLRTKANQISRLAHESDEPIFLTRNGEGDLVVMSMAHYSRMQRKFDLFSKLEVAEQSRANGDKGKPLSQITRELRKRLRATGKV
jgi:prevent-host-death family protein